MDRSSLIFRRASGNHLKRCIAGLVGLVYGAVLTWVYVKVLDQFNWSHNPYQMSVVCHEQATCPPHWWTVPFFLAYFLGPAILFTALNVYAWRKWSPWSWAYAVVVLTILVFILYFVDVFVGS